LEGSWLHCLGDMLLETQVRRERNKKLYEKHYIDQAEFNAPLRMT